MEGTTVTHPLPESHQPDACPDIRQLHPFAQERLTITKQEYI